MSSWNVKLYCYHLIQVNACLRSFACGENWHDPVQCVWLKKWIKKCDDDSETSNWIAANTRVTMKPN
jgi:hypothetical protein